MRVAVLGVGGVGRALVSELAKDERVTSFLLVDRLGERLRAPGKLRSRVPVESVKANIEDRTELARALRGTDVVVNAAHPKYNLSVMETALDLGSNYLDLAATGPRRPGALPGILEQLERNDAVRAAGVTALLSMGLDPGMSNVLAREAADKLDTIDAIRIRSGGTAILPGFGSSFPLYSPEAFLSDILLRPTVWEDGRLRDREPFAEEEDYRFPSPVGVQRCYLISHEEVKTLPRFLGKPVRRVDFKYAVDPRLMSALLGLNGLGFLKDSRTIRIGDRKLPFRKALLAVFPEPAGLRRALKGTKCVSVEVEGRKGRLRKLYRSYISLSHREANRRARTTAVYYLTAQGAAIGVSMILQRALPGPGVYPPEALPPRRVLDEWTSKGLTVRRSEHNLDPKDVGDGPLSVPWRTPRPTSGGNAVVG